MTRSIADLESVTSQFKVSEGNEGERPPGACSAPEGQRLTGGSGSRKLSICHGLVLAQVMLLSSIFLLEVSFRAVHFDFSGQRSAFMKVPVAFRDPTLPVGPGLFRRPGPARVEGRPLTFMLRSQGGLDRAYETEPIVVVEYDSLGFRNPEDLRDWEIVVAGDSFTELGHLPYQDLWTTEASRILNCKIKNLGASHTGPLTQTFYLKEYGKSPRTRIAIIAFFEGNDLYDLLDEESRVLHSRVGRADNPYQFEPQTSLIKHALKTLFGDRPTKKYFQNAYYVCDGTKVPVTVHYTPLGSKDLDPGMMALLENAVAGWGETARALGLKPWLLYMPSKERVLHGHLEFLDRADRALRAWSPTDLPDVVNRFCAKHGIRFLDLTPVLAGESDKGVLTYNGVFDSHLNRTGALRVGQALAQALQPEFADTAGSVAGTATPPSPQAPNAK
jgi:hypothetical protein